MTNPRELDSADHRTSVRLGWPALAARRAVGQDSATGRLTFRYPDVTGLLVSFLADHGWRTWSATGVGPVLECGTERVDVRELTVTGTDLPGYAGTSPDSLRSVRAAQPW